MPTENVFIEGMTKWAYVKNPNEWGAWSIGMYIQGSSLERMRELQAKGMKNAIKKDEDGWFIGFRRPMQQLIRGKQVVFPPPEVFGPDGKTPLTEDIGRGSKVTVKLECYTHGTPGGGKAIAARLAGVKVDELVPVDFGVRNYEAEARGEPLF